MRKWHFPKVNLRLSHTIVRQHDLNKLMVGEAFNPTVHQIQLLALFFFAQTYAGGLPLMIPLCGVTFINYFLIDKLLLLRHYQKPPHVGPATIHIVQSLMPYSVMIRLAMSSWMYSAPGTVISYVAENNSYTDSSKRSNINGVSYYSALSALYNRISRSAPALDAIANRLCAPQVFPLILLLFIIVIIKVIIGFSQSGIGHISTSIVSSININIPWTLCSCQKKIVDESASLQADIVTLFDIAKRGDTLRQEVAPFSREYFKYILPSMTVIPREISCCHNEGKVRDLLTKHEMARGWEIGDKEGLKVKVKRWGMERSPDRINNTYTDDGDSNGGHAHVGDEMFTYEIIQEYGCSSYALDRIPAYFQIILGITQAVIALVKRRQEVDQGHEHSSHVQVRYEDVYSL